MKPENQIDLIAKGLGNGSFIAGYNSMDRLYEFVEASLHGGGNAHLIVAMTIATCKNLIDEQLQGEQQ
jgi:acetylornithine/succinyldiaminopimelate/putrescine aminotransferase